MVTGFRKALAARNHRQDRALRLYISLLLTPMLVRLPFSATILTS